MTFSYRSLHSSYPKRGVTTIHYLSLHRMYHSPLLPHSCLLAWVLLRWVNHVKVEVTNPFCSMGHRAERARGSDRPDHKGLSDRVGGTLELGCNPPRRTVQNQTKGRRHSGSCGERKSYKGVNPDKKSWPFRLRVL